MNILLLSVVKSNSIEDKGIYSDLLRTFRNNGHNVFMITTIERRDKGSTQLIEEGNSKILHIKTLNLQKSNLIEKGLSIFLLEYQYKAAIKKYFNDVNFEIVIYTTPPITYSSAINYLKKKDKVFSYLLLKDIFPQNAIDMKMMRENGILYKYFRKKEIELYNISDKIGCMSQANVDYILQNNPEVKNEKVEINYNSVELSSNSFNTLDKEKIRTKFNIPLNKKVFIYGGNLGKPQGLDFLLITMELCKRNDVFFIVVGDGVEYNRIADWFSKRNPNNALLIKYLPKNDFDTLVAASDVGLIFLHPDFKIPNFPSRLLTYLEYSLPVISATDNVTDIGKLLEKEQCGFHVLSGDLENMLKKIDLITDEEKLYHQMRLNAKRLLIDRFLVQDSYDKIINAYNENKKQ